MTTERRHEDAGVHLLDHGVPAKLRGRSAALHDDRLAHGDHHALDLEQGALLLRAALRDALQDGRVEVGELRLVVDLFDLHAAGLVQVVELLGVVQPPLHLLRVAAAGEELVEDVVVALALHLEDQARLLEQVRLPAGEEVARLAILVELQLHELAEARGVRVAEGLRVPKGSRIGFVSMIFLSRSSRRPRWTAEGEVLKHDSSRSPSCLRWTLDSPR